MRERKFRAKVIHHPLALNNDKTIGEWVVGDLHLKCKIPHIHFDIHKKYPIDKDTIGEFTGRKDDCEEEEMYEGDICDVWEYGENCKIKNKARVVIEYNDTLCGFVFKDIKRNVSSLMGSNLHLFAKVIGNIHDNPELLKDK